MRIILLSLFMLFACVDGYTEEELQAVKNKTDENMAQVEALKSQLAEMKSKIDLFDQHVYFLPTFQSPTLNIKPGTVVFDKVLANTGNAYNSSSGIFTASCPGLYAITVQTFTYGSGDANWNLNVNGQRALRGRSVTTLDTSNNYVYPVTLKSGDSVSVYNMVAIRIYGTNHSVMGGWLIKAL